MGMYVGTKLVEAEPETYGTFHNAADAKEANELGYRVRYADGHESWSPKATFDAAYLRIVTNDKLKTNKPSISQQMVDDFIAGYQVTTLGDKCTVVRALLRNGFEIVESSACVSAENYDEKLGEEICMEKIKDKVWFLLGFLLQTGVNGIDSVHFTA